MAIITNIEWSEIKPTCYHNWGCKKGMDKRLRKIIAIWEDMYCTTPDEDEIIYEGEN